MRRLFLPAVAVFAAPVPAAEAVGFMTQLSCASDYYAYCSKHKVGSAGLRKCMNDNGPKLSKSCINALVADGEISKAEVARRREQVAAAKAQPKPEQKPELKDAGKSAGTPKQNAARVPEIRKPQPTDLLVTNALALDQKTYEALKNRGDYFVIDTGMSEPSPRAIANNSDAPAVDVPSVLNASEATSEDRAATPAIAATVPPVAAAKALAQPVPAPVRPAEDIPGKMALGKKPSTETPPAVEEVVVSPKPSSVETWLDYMKNRFDGGMNYEGVDANF